MDRQRFFEACNKIINYERTRSGIGTLGEKTLHAILKYYYEPYSDSHEVKLGNFVADIVGENGIIEIQTANFNKLRKKLESFLALTTVTVVYPIPRTKYLIWLDQSTGETTKKRKSPKTGTPYQIFQELYWIKPLLTHENLRILIVMLDITEYRYLNGWSEDRKKGSSRYERIPTDIIDEVHINSLRDFHKLIPKNLPDEFTAKDYRLASGLSLRTAQIALNILHYVNAVERVGKKGNAFIYKKTLPSPYYGVLS